MNRFLPQRSQTFQRNTRPAQSCRSGSLIIEVIVASILMASLAAIFVPGIAAVNRQRLSIRSDALLLVELNNVAERSKVQSADNLKLSGWFMKRYPEASLAVTPVAEAITFQPDAKQSDAAQPDGPDEDSGTNTWSGGLKLQITLPSQHSGLNTTRSLTVWPNHKATEGASE